MREILESLLSQIKDEVTIDFVDIQPAKPFPFPWNAYAFFDAMPETVQRIPIAVQPLPATVKNADYDLVVLGYQPWFLNPSQPITGFLKGSEAAMLNGKPVVTVVGCRNMWLHGQEQVKKDLQEAGAKLVGNIVLNDTHTNLVSLLTIIRWAFKGQKQASGLLPAAGVQDEDIRGASRFGTMILDHLKRGSFNGLQEDLVKAGAVTLDPGLILLEQRGIKNFRYWAGFIREKGGAGDPARRGRVLLFKRLLLTAIFVLSPLSSLSAFIKLQMKKRKLMRDTEYFKGLELEEGRI